MKRPLVLLALLASPSLAWAKDFPVSNTTELGAAIGMVAAGDTITLADGTYMSTGFSCTKDGTPQMPITVRAKNPLAALIRFDALEGFKVIGDHWHFEGLDVRGVCANDNNCEHAFHVIGGEGFVLRGSRVVDFNAQLKVNATKNGNTWKIPHKGLIEGNELFDTRARMTSNPTTKLNIDTGDDWIVRANFIHDFHKGGGDNVSYGTFLKCGCQRGVIERNLVLCSRDHSGGFRRGLSLGGGGCAPQFCAPAFDANTPCLEHVDGIVRNNIVANCSDAGIYVNASKNSKVLYNTLIGTIGIDFQFPAATGEARGNVLTGVARNRNSSTATFTNNLEMVSLATFSMMYEDPLKGDLRKKGDLSALLGKGASVPQVTDDYCARARKDPFDLGALQHSLGDCSMQPPVTDGGAGNPDGGAGNPDGGASGSDASDADGGGQRSPASGGCSCELVPQRAGDLSGGLAAALALLLVLRRRA